MEAIKDAAAAAAEQLGFSYDARLGKWWHPDHKDYAALRAKYAVEDYPDLVKARRK